MVTNIRKTALEMLRSYEEEGRYVNLLLSSPKLKKIAKEELSSLTALLYTTVENKLRYDYLISSYSKRSISEIDPYVRDVLRIGVCQILDMESVPDFAAVNESVKLARHGGEAGFINAVLRKISKEKENLPYPKREKNIHRYLSVIYSVPYSTVKLLSSILGADECEKLLSAFASKQGISLTVNEAKISTDALIEKLSSFGAKRAPFTSNGVELEKSVAPKSLPGFDGGEFFVQDEASRIAASALDVREGDVVVDVCSAPGGKALAAAIKASVNGEVFAFDLHESKLSLITESAERLGLKNLKVNARDAREPDEELFLKADRVICDVPCSGLGVFAKKPDLRYKDLSGISDLPPLQYEILEKSALYLKPGGVLVYSTCTLNPEENEKITDRFVSEHSEFEYASVEIGGLNFDSGRITLLPHKHGTDGFYIAKLRKKDE